MDICNRMTPNTHMSLHNTYPAISDLRAGAKKRIPSFVWEYLDSAAGDERTKMRNQARLRQVGLTPSVLHGEFTPDLSTTFLGQKLPLPFGISPIGMSGLIWPNAEQLLAKSAASLGIPYTLSTVAAQAPEDLAPHLGENAWHALQEVVLY